MLHVRDDHRSTRHSYAMGGHDRDGSRTLEAERCRVWSCGGGAPSASGSGACAAAKDNDHEPTTEQVPFENSETARRVAFAVLKRQGQEVIPIAVKVAEGAHKYYDQDGKEMTWSQAKTIAGARRAIVLG